MTPSSTFTAADGDGYELLMGRWSRRLADPFLDFAGTTDGESVLDVGCGTGCLSVALTKRCQVKQVRGVDFSPEYIEYAKRHIDDPRIAFEVGDACALAFPDRSYDRVLSLLMLHFVPRADEAIAEMRRVPPRRRRWCGGVGRARGICRESDVLRYCRRAGSQSGRAPGAQLHAPDDAAGGVSECVARGGPHRRGRDGFAHPHGVRIVRRLLGAIHRE